MARYEVTAPNGNKYQVTAPEGATTTELREYVKRNHPNSLSGAVGKNYGDDFREGKITLPVIMAFRRGDEVERVFWSRVIKSPSDSKADLDQAIQYLQKTRAIDETLDRAAHYGHRAKDALALFPDSDLKQQLLELVDFCIGREH